MSENNGADFYIARLWDSAKSETCNYWSTSQIVVTIASPVFGGVLWSIFKPWPGWWAIMQVAAISVLGFFALWSLIFFVTLVMAPARVDKQLRAKHARELGGLDKSLADKNQMIGTLQDALRQKHPHDETKERLVREALQKLDEQELSCIDWLLATERAGMTETQRSGFRGLPRNIVNKTGAVHLLIETPIRAANGMEIDTQYAINSELRQILKDIRYPPRPVSES